MGRRSSVPQIGPVRWIFIKSPVPHQPYAHIRKLYEIELRNSKANKLSDLEKDELIKIREKTRLVLKQKQRKEATINIIALSIIMITSIVAVFWLIKG